MKHVYTTVILLFMTFTLQAQQHTYEFSISFVGINTNTGNYQMALLATPSESVVDDSTDDMGAGFYVPTGMTIGNFVTGNSNLPASEWVSISMGPGANGDAYFLGRDEAGQFSVLLNGAGPFELVLFDVIADPNPTTGAIMFVENGDPVFDTIFIENYINIATQNLYSQNNPTANSVSFETLNTETIAIDNTLAIYPNPVTDVLHINTPHTINSMALYSILGKKVFETSQNTNQINVTAFQPGIYLLKVQTSYGYVTKKIVIE
ncbi:Por secretion system C-terminal sorting domain-containing protein [Bizionia echini]|uniref:Por secretion system C-terminal sorting domain-containing protein n=1 Tax=Bizionia echini TaxID=649333 RepID=A0A1I5AKL1_9FLAO|nr:T9SS type A sorting domain-containing protein [Bizionia echini]SFN62900.1 Por secretion system C-terminal sorting domain-containing protein [Bizionia echini]